MKFNPSTLPSQYLLWARCDYSGTKWSKCHGQNHKIERLLEKSQGNGIQKDSAVFPMVIFLYSL